MSHIFELIDRLSCEHTLEYAQYLRLLRSWRTIDKSRLFALARETAAGVYDRDIYLRGLVEITNHCKNDCLYCGIRASNTRTSRYRLSGEDVMECCRHGYALGLRTFVLQGGEDSMLTDGHICELVSAIRESCPDAAVTLSLGEKAYESYAAYRKAGADRYLLRHETADAAHYASLHPRLSFENRRRCLRDLKALGYQTGAGFMVGSPGQTAETLAADLSYLQALQPHMAGIGPFIPHRDTPFSTEPPGSADLTLILLALVRLMLPEVLLPVTTALETLDSGGYERGIMAGANVIMLNLTPQAERAQYLLYDGKSGASADELAAVESRMNAIGYRMSSSRGDYAAQSQIYSAEGEGNPDPLRKEAVNYENLQL